MVSIWKIYCMSIPGILGCCYLTLQATQHYTFIASYPPFAPQPTIVLFSNLRMLVYLHSSVYIPSPGSVSGIILCLVCPLTTISVQTLGFIHLWFELIPCRQDVINPDFKSQKFIPISCTFFCTTIPSIFRTCSVLFGVMWLPQPTQLPLEGRVHPGQVTRLFQSQTPTDLEAI